MCDGLTGEQVEVARVVASGRHIVGTTGNPSPGERVQNLLSADTTALFLNTRDEPEKYRARLAIGELADALRADTILEGEGILGDVIRSRTPEFVNDTGADPRTVDIPGTDDHSPEIERLTKKTRSLRDAVSAERQKH